MLVSCFYLWQIFYFHELDDNFPQAKLFLQQVGMQILDWCFFVAAAAAAAVLECSKVEDSL